MLFKECNLDLGTSSDNAADFMFYFNIVLVYPPTGENIRYI